jgi:hypothetical protein
MNPITSTTTEMTLAYRADHRMEELYDVLDDLHTAASEATLATVTTMNESDLLDFLKELVYTAQETIKEIEQHTSKRRSRPANIISFAAALNVTDKSS